MIQWIALGVAVDANGKAREANRKLDKAAHKARSSSEMVIIRPVDLVAVPTGEPAWKLLGFIPIVPKKLVLPKKPWCTISINKVDIINIEEEKDDDGQKYCVLKISEYAKVTRPGLDEDEYVETELLVPGSIESVTGAIGGLR